ncbi:MAG: hypothetical protein VXX95_00805 [Candidatus Thermoplasmatota archaeon]|nr:hypothetical protein [Candidatus Thermoplasmatota archaeon]MEC7723271.1 hypothetical protein [Candidatus Thermoplasmatota archaeon]MEC8741567.1 hypothetical protein [Candidatus Thermoplasmatota archaeon]MEC8780087.1 hypothetical protein [Candidatus Thermoplasmatota archaeon]MEE3090477.1 hypothetical protein [Candidatus Thermoplasmatota archaeon]
MEPVSVDLRLEGHASSASVVEGMDGVTTSTEDNVLVLQITAPTLREVQEVLDAALAALNEAQTAG